MNPTPPPPPPHARAGGSFQDDRQHPAGFEVGGEVDAALAVKFSALLADLDSARSVARAALFFSLLLLLVATLLRLGGGDLGFLAAGGGEVRVGSLSFLMCVCFIPTLFAFAS